MGLSPDGVARVERATLLMNAGATVGYLRAKRDELTPQEVQRVVGHPLESAFVCRDAVGLSELIPIVAAHHEAWDGKGYPAGLAGEAIPLEARIIAVADAFVAMTTPRIHAPMLDVFAAMDRLRAGAGKQFDPVVVDAFIGRWVKRRFARAS
jgi:HD-GYP domain-containing protein (c-di-GMP phosphodiesterase class II)